MWNPFKKKGKGITTEAAAGDWQRYQGSGVCDVCNGPVNPGEAFMVPTRVFWESKKYKRWLSDNPVTSSMIKMAGVTVEQHIAMQKQMDQTEYSAVCPNCVHLFR